MSALWGTYRENIHDHIIQADMKNLDPSEIPDAELFVGGFPCQSFSYSGLRAGLEDSRGILFYEIAKIINFKQPPMFLLENVAGL